MSSVLSAFPVEPPPEECAFERGMETPVLRRRRQIRKATKLARVLVSLDDSARAARHEAPRKTLRASLSGAR